MSHPRREPITSPHNPLLKEVRRASVHGGLTRAGLCLAEGPRLLEEALRSRLEIGAVLATEKALAGVEKTLKNAAVTRLFALSPALFQSIATTENPQGVVALVRPPAWREDDLLHKTPLVVVLDGIQDPGNAGTLLRAAEAFGATGAIFLQGSVSPSNPKTLRASAGSLFRLPVLDSVPAGQALEMLARRGVTAWTTLPEGGVPVHQADLRAACAVVVGSEARGVSDELRASLKSIMIPTRKVESLNAAVAGAVVLYEAARQRGFQ